MTAPQPRRVAQGGPPLVLLAAVFSALFLAGLIAGAALGDGTFPSPYASADSIQAYFAGNAAAVRTSAVLQFAAAVPLAILAATASARLHNLGIRAPGATIALAGGLLASAFLTLSALLQWLLSRPEVAAEPALVRALHDLTFLTGGPAHVAPSACWWPASRCRACWSGSCRAGLRSPGW